MQLWAEDEARFGLLPSYRRIWALRGHRPTASSRRKYQWKYLYCFVHPTSGRTVNLVGDQVCSFAMSAALAHFAQQVGAGPLRRIALVLDGAGWHKAKDLVIPEGIHPMFLPPYSPELQPAERVWPVINEGIANRGLPNMEALAAVINQRVEYLNQSTSRIRRLTAYHWWPSDRVARTSMERES